jgi:hypothetical protein
VSTNLVLGLRMCGVIVSASSIRFHCVVLKLRNNLIFYFAATHGM